MNRPVLIVGGGPSGLSAAHALAAAGQRVVLVDKAEQLGGAPILSGYAKLVPSGEWAKDAIGGMVKRIEGNKLVDVRKNTTVRTFVGQPGDFHATLSDGTQVDPGTVILCTGFTHFDSINKPEWGFGTYPDVVTTTQVEQMFSSGKGVRCPSDGRLPERVAILLCVGSRDRQIGREWCSKICCTVSSNLAMEIREALPKCSVYIYYMDIRTFGLYEGQYYWESQEKFKVKYIKARIAEVTSDGKRLIVKGEDTLVKRPITIPFDMVVHAIGMDPNVDNMTLSAVFDVKLEKYGHIQKASTYSNMSATSRPGVFVAGAATGPETIDDSIAQGQSAAMAALNLIRNALAGGGRVMWVIGSHKAKAAPAPARPVLDLSGPRLRQAFENLVECAEDTGGVERYVGALALKASLFEEVLGKGKVGELTEPEFYDLAAFVTPVRRRIGAWLGRNGFAAMRGRLVALLDGWSDLTTVDQRLNAFVASFPADREHRWSRDLAAEVLHFTAPERYPLMTRWMWDARVNTGVLREIWHSDTNVEVGTLAVGDGFATFATLREELEGFLQANGVFRDLALYSDLLCAHVYAAYINDKGGQYLRADFCGGAKGDAMAHTRRLLGLDAVDTESGRTRLKLIDGEAYVLGEQRRLSS